MEPIKIVHTQGGVIKGVCSPREALGQLLRLQPFSTNYATRWGGWRQIEMYGETDVVFTRDVMRSEFIPLAAGEEDYVEVTAGTVGILGEDKIDHWKTVITISVGGDSGFIYPADSYKLTPLPSVSA